MNSVNLIGRLTRDIEMRTAKDDMAIATFTLAVDRMGEDADFIRCKAFGKRAETMNQYLGKGKRVGITGRIQTGSYKDKDDKTVYTTDVIVDSFTFCDSKKYSPAPDGFSEYDDENDDMPF